MGNICIDKKRFEEQQEIQDIEIISKEFDKEQTIEFQSQLEDETEQFSYVLQKNENMQEILPKKIKNLDYDLLDLECLEQILDHKEKLYRNEKEKYYFQGQLEGNQKQGFCQILSDDGNFIAGNFKDDKLQGKGFYINKNNDFYQGDFVNNQFHGEGILKNLDTKTKYHGEFKYDKKHGEGIESWADGSQYIGQYKKNKKCGKGKYQFPDGSIYNGEFKNDDMEGEGEINWQNGQSYKGQFQNNTMHGYGIFQWEDGNIYKGYFQNNKKSGEGEIKWTNNISFKEGKGVMIDKLGRVTVGMWKNGQLQDKFKEVQYESPFDNSKQEPDYNL